jgi:hypothetical protein
VSQKSAAHDFGRASLATGVGYRQPCCGVGHSGGGATQLRSLQFLPESIVRFMRRMFARRWRPARQPTLRAPAHRDRTKRRIVITRFGAS